MTWLPFLPRFVPYIRAGDKTMTARSKPYGKAGDVLRTPAGPVRLLSVRHVCLGFVRDFCWDQEGLNSPQEFEEVWRQIHPKAGFDPGRKVYLHHFEHIGEDEDSGVSG